MKNKQELLRGLRVGLGGLEFLWVQAFSCLEFDA